MRLFGPFYEDQKRAGATFGDFFGHQIPLVYTSEAEELQRIHTSASFTEYHFLSHLAVEGKDAERFLQQTTPSNVERLAQNQVLYTVFLKPDGSVIEDVVIFKIQPDFFLLHMRPRRDCHNPRFSNLLGLKEPKNWLVTQAEGLNVALHETGLYLFSIQGPTSRDVLREIVDLDDLPYLHCKFDNLKNIPVLIARLGYSGELGYEFFIWPEYAHAIWDLALELGLKPYGAKTTRIIGLEKGYLAHPDYFPNSTPLELGMEWIVDFEKKNFVGRDTILTRKENGLQGKLIGFEIEGQNFTVNHDTKIYSHGQCVGACTTSAYSPFLKMNLGRGWIENSASPLDTVLEIHQGERHCSITLNSGYRWYDPEGRLLKV